MAIIMCAWINATSVTLKIADVYAIDDDDDGRGGGGGILRLRFRKFDFNSQLLKWLNI